MPPRFRHASVHRNPGDLRADIVAIAEELQSKFNRTADAWDHIPGLRYGNRINRQNGNATSKTSGPTPHPNQWNLQHMMRLAFASLGKSKTSRLGIDGATHAMAAITVTASIAELLQLESIDSFFHRKPTRPHSGRWL